MPLPDPLLRLIEELQRQLRHRFPALANPRFYPQNTAQAILASAIVDVKESVTYCSVCNNITDSDPCAYCRSEDRDRAVICVVEEPQMVSAIEKTREFKGRITCQMSLQGVGPDDLRSSC